MNEWNNYVEMNEWKKERKKWLMHAWTNEWMNKWLNEWINENNPVEINEWTNEWINKWMNVELND